MTSISFCILNSFLNSVDSTKRSVYVGQKLIYSKLLSDTNSVKIKEAVECLFKAKISEPVYHTSANGIPLGAEIDRSICKTFFLDIGLMQHFLGRTLSTIQALSAVQLVNEGSMAEQFVGQHLLYLGEPYRKPELYYWLREGKKINAEIDYLWPFQHYVVPIEVKASKSGSLKSLFYFCEQKKLNWAVRFDLNKPSCFEAKHII